MWVLLPARQVLTGIEKSSFFVVLETDSSDELCSAGNRFAADCFKRSSLLWMRRSRWRGRPPSCRRHHQGVAGQGNISDLNQITDIDWEEQTYSMHLISSWESLPSSTWPPLGCYLISALGSTSSSAPLQVHLGRRDLPLNTITRYYFINLLSADTPDPLNIMFWFHGYESVLARHTKKQFCRFIRWSYTQYSQVWMKLLS